jgi:hypothetical protein
MAVGRGHWWNSNADHVPLVARSSAPRSGEYESIEFPKLGWRIYISNESHSPTTGRGGSMYQVTALQS